MNSILKYGAFLQWYSFFIIVVICLLSNFVYGQEKLIFIDDFSETKFIDFQLITFENNSKKIIEPTKDGTVSKADVFPNDSIYFLTLESEKIVIDDLKSFQDTVIIHNPHLILDDIVVKIVKIGKTSSTGINYSFLFNLSSLNRVKIDSSLIGKKIVSFNFYYKNLKAKILEIIILN